MQAASGLTRRLHPVELLLTAVSPANSDDRNRKRRKSRDPSSEVAPGPVPYLRVRDRLEARLVTSVYYDLAELAEPGPPDGRLGVWSAGRFFPLEPEPAGPGAESVP